MCKLLMIVGMTASAGTWIIAGAEAADGKASGEAKSIHDFTVKSIDGEEVPLARYKGKVLLLVNVASRCGLTPSNYAGMNELYARYKDKGLEILAFPANNFAGQEPGSNDEIKEFCATKDVAFPLFAKVSVKGEDQCPLYRFLTKHPDEKIAGDVQWNFQKYLVDRDGKVIARFSPRTKPTDQELVSAIEKALAG